MARREHERVVFVLPRYGVGGAEKQLANLIAHRPSSARSLDVRVVTFLPTASPEVEQRFVDAGVRTTLVDRSRRSFVPFFLELLSTMRSLAPGTVNTFLDGSTGTWGRLAAWLTGVPNIIHSDRLLVPSSARSDALLRPFLDRRTGRFLPNASAIAERLMKAGVPEEKICVVPNGVDLNVFDPASVPSPRAEWGVKPGETVLGFLGRFAPIKRIDLILEAVLTLDPGERPDWLVLAGEGESMPAVRSIVERDDWLRDHVRLLGVVHNTPAFLSGIDYLVLASDSEGLPNVVLEAMAMGKPVVATRVSDVPRILGTTAGFLAEPGDRDSLASAIRRMQGLGHDGRRELGANARARVEQDYSMEAAAARFWAAHLEAACP